MTRAGLFTKFPRPERSRWQPLRAGIQNIWQYDDHRFCFHRGRLLLRGRNESGKTKALELLLPFLLDGSKDARKLDPFGSSSRTMYWNLINDKYEHESRIGYAWLEFGRRDEAGEHYCTIGAGLRAKKANPSHVDVWYFLTERRIDQGLELVVDGHPRTRRDLEQVLAGSGNVFHDDSARYRQAVNRTLFGMEAVQYEFLIDLLVQLRRPQLSKTLDPTALSALLSESLPPLDRTVIRSLSEGFERLEEHKVKREAMAAGLETVQGFLERYRGYIALLAKARARSLLSTNSAYEQAQSILVARQEQLNTTKTALANLGSRMQEGVDREAQLEVRSRTLRASEEFRAIEELTRATQEADAAARKARQSEDRLRVAQDEVSAQGIRVDHARWGLAAAHEEVARESAQAMEFAEDAGLSREHASVAEAALAGDDKAARGVLQSILTVRQQAIAALRSEHQQVLKAEDNLRRARDRLDAADERLREEKVSLDEAEHTLRREEGTLRAATDAWAASLTELVLDSAAQEALQATPVTELRDVVARYHHARRAELEELRARHLAQHKQLSDRIDELADLLDELACQPHAQPQPPSWRTPRSSARPGAPLYLLCDFAPTFEERECQAHVEAALLAAGLLDAWVDPEGLIYGSQGPEPSDVLLRPEPRLGKTLYDVLRPTSAGGVSERSIERVLRTIALVPRAQDAAEEVPYWIGLDGTFRLGPLRGAHRQSEPAYIGETARTQERQRRREALEAQQTQLVRQRSSIEGALQTLRERLQRLDAEFARFPSLEKLQAARARAVVAIANFEKARQARDLAEAAQQQALRVLHEQVRQRDQKAVELGLERWVAALEELAERTREYRERAQEFLHAAQRQAAQELLFGEVELALKKSRTRWEECVDEAEVARGDALRTQARVDALQAVVGATHQQLLNELQEAEAELQKLRSELKSQQARKERLERERGAREKGVEEAAQHVTEAEHKREGAQSAFKGFAQRGLLAFLTVTPAIEPLSWNLAETLNQARLVDAATGTVEPTDAAQEDAANQLWAHHQDVLHTLPEGVHLSPQMEDGILCYRAIWYDRSLKLLELHQELARSLADREHLLNAQEQALLESFLSGEAHNHMGKRLRAARTLIHEINEQLYERPTPGGQLLRLRWTVREDEAHQGAREAIEAMLLDGPLVSANTEMRLRQFIKERLALAREALEGKTLEERLLSALDYRRWHEFQLEIRTPPRGWHLYTKKEFGKGSGGQKAYNLHMPLFAAASAFYKSARETAPRLIMLDEAFAGIDREARGDLMGLLVQFELDFVMTSYEEWGFYQQLDGLATYQLSRDLDPQSQHPGILAERFIWDGRRKHEAAAA